MSFKTLITVKELHSIRQEWSESGKTVAFIPTMGALHKGHLSLIDKGKELADQVIVSIFVNPTQFGPNEDFAKYPRTLKSDLEKLGETPASAVFLPNTLDIYPEGFQTYICNRKLAKDLCGMSRPGHFDGVLTVVLKLFNMVKPDKAIFGKKDYQQWRLIELMTRDLNLGLTIIGGDIVREPDGLAMSSRNQYLDKNQRLQASQIYRSLGIAKEKFSSGSRNAKEIMDAAKKCLNSVPEISLEYLEIRKQDNLEKFGNEQIESPTVVLFAGRMGEVRLIDNIELNP